MIYSDETQRVLRDKRFIKETEIAMTSGDLILAEDVITKERRILDSAVVQPHLRTNNIVEANNKTQLLKG
jgi:hypothetical protein